MKRKITLALAAALFALLCTACAPPNSPADLHPEAHAALSQASHALRAP
ncbi:hypothetical protein [Lysobacter sp. CA199]